ncbi:GNAT family N-acetyltransferase [Vibrio sp. 10N]|uniref:GNAT family N-acetyltransferase n=1 Tax=Vibrio sp. 10N TaxID=3058938 RepID=UPI002813603B|nr:GNAT family N-acetyltransferase [Vibrio sp. 10N]
MTITVQLAPNPATEELVNLSVDSSQVEFVGVVSDILQASLAKPSESQWVIYSNDIAVGFFLLDQDYANTIDGVPKGAIGLRAFFIDQRYQGLGLAKAAIKLITQGFSTWLNQSCTELYLTVNCRNKPAYELYIKSGFVDTQTLYLGGEAGPQHIMCFKSKKMP